jgi:hypothetical protein
VFSSDTDEVFPGFSTDVVVVLLERYEEHVDVKGREIDFVDVEVCYILCERGTLRRGEGVGMGIDSPERHGCYVGCLWACENGCRFCLSGSNRDMNVTRFWCTRCVSLSLYTRRRGPVNNRLLLSCVNVSPYFHVSVSI